MHKSVLLKETIEGLNLGGKTSPIVLDGTLGGGGHSAEICKTYPGVKIIALDQDKSVWARSKEKFQNLNCTISFVNANFRDLDKVLAGQGIERVDGIIFDLGLSSDQLENSGRGFSFLKDEPLIMNMKEGLKPQDLTAKEIVNTWSEENLATIIYGYGEERFSKRIASAIALAREKKKIETTYELVEIIKRAVPGEYRRARIHPATRTFQALRIAVNDELGALSEGLVKGFDVLSTGGRLAVITFHSLEDRIVKRFFVSMVGAGQGRLVNKKIITGSEEEVKNNPRARSAKLRIIEKLTNK
jgi:16S rRNA (cytosine1402-N4)-methyltransferase